MGSEKNLTFHFFMLSVFGVLHPENASIVYKIWSVISFIFIGLSLPVLQLMSMIYSTSGSDAIKVPVLMFTALSTCLKCILIYRNHDKFKQLQLVMHEMDTFLDINSEAAVIDLQKRCRAVRLIFKSMYWGSYLSLLVELGIFGTNTFWQSTTLWPYEWSHNYYVYSSLLVLQMFSNAVNCTMAAVTDSFGSILSIILSGHLQVLGSRLSKMDSIRDLLKCVKYHDLCLK